MPITDPGVLPVATSLLDCLQTALLDVADPPEHVSLRVGVQIELLLSETRDECCEGVGWVRVVSIYPSAVFPLPDLESVACWPIQWAAILEMGVARCAPTPDASEMPSSDEWNTVAEAVLDDAAAMRRALCCFTDLQPDRMYVPGLWQPLPIDGGCLGGSMQVTVAIDACDCTD
jgi:hypothetical protein